MLEVLFAALLVYVGVDYYNDNNWKYVGYHECKQIGTIEPGKAEVHPLTVEEFNNNYILFKQQNDDGSYTVSCVNPKEN